MVAHLACPALGDGTLPATLAPRIATDLLRGDLGYKGLAVTDSMDMQGVAATYGFEEAAVRALSAGCDLLLYCFDIDAPRRALAGLRAGIDSGRLSRSRLAEAAERVAGLQAKAAARAAVGKRPRQPEAGTAAAARYRELCRRALQLHEPAGWRRLAQAARERQTLVLAGWQPELLERLGNRLQARGLGVRMLAPEALQPEPGLPVVAVLGERRPLAADKVACLRRLALVHEPLGLANLLTPEVDAPLVESFTCILRSADQTDAMLDVVAPHLLDEDAIA
jgi:hypothetical protein